MMLDKLPAMARHLLIVFAGSFLGFVAQVIVKAQGITAVAWSHELILALNTSVVATVTIGVALYLTPLTKQYGLSKTPGA
jgi:hypothetical protein